MILALALICVAAGVVAAWVSRPLVRLLPVIIIAGASWIGGVLLINLGVRLTQNSAPTENGFSGIVTLGLLLILTGLAVSTALAIGRLMRGRARTGVVGLVAGALTFICLAIFYIVAIGG